MSKKSIHILVVEDEEAHAELVSRAFESKAGKFCLAVSGSLKEAREYLSEYTPNLIIADLFLPDGNGIDLLRDGEVHQIPVVVMTGHGDEHVAVEAIKTGALDYVVKSEVSLAEMPHIAERALREWRHIIDRKQAEEALRNSEEQLRLVTDAMPAYVSCVDSKYCYRFVNKMYEQLYGLSRNEICGQHIKDVMGESAYQKIQGYVEAALSGEEVSYESALPLKDVGMRYFHATYIPHIGNKGEVEGFFTLIMDITDQKEAQEQLKLSLQEKEVLLKEIHHRVKNNLQVVSSLFYLPSEYIEDKQSLKILNETRNRVKSMALIHERLYQSKDLARIGFAEYTRKLAADLFHSYGVNQSVIALKVNVDDVLLNVDTAIPCGLIVNELVSNSLKHAFPSGRKGEICIEIRSGEGGKLTLIVSDNGTGFPGDLDFRNTGSLGLRLVNILTAQLDGTIELDRSGGTAFKITFPGIQH